MHRAMATRDRYHGYQQEAATARSEAEAANTRVETLQAQIQASTRSIHPFNPPAQYSLSTLPQQYFVNLQHTHHIISRNNITQHKITQHNITHHTSQNNTGPRISPPQDRVRASRPEDGCTAYQHGYRARQRGLEPYSRLAARHRSCCKEKRWGRRSRSRRGE